MKNDPNMGFEEYALAQLRLYKDKANVKAGSGVDSPKEKRKAAKEKKSQEQAEQERLEKEAGLHPPDWTKYVRVVGRIIPMGEKGSCHATEKVQPRVQTSSC